MDIVINFALSILGSIIAAIIVFLTATWASKNARWVLTAIASATLKVDIKYVFKNSRDAEIMIKEALEKATDIKIFTSRGNQFQRDTYAVLFQKNYERKRTIRILLPNPDKVSGNTDWIDHREKEIEFVGKAYRKGILRQQIKSTIEYLIPFIEPGRFEIRMYDAPHLARVIITEEYLFLQPYKEGVEGRDCPVIQYGRGDTYDMFHRFFYMIWEVSKIKTS